MMRYNDAPRIPSAEQLPGNPHYARAHNPTLSQTQRDESAALAGAYETRANTLIALAETYRAQGDTETFTALRDEAQAMLNLDTTT